MRTIKIFISLIALLIATSFLGNAQDAAKNVILQSLESQYALTKPTADNTDIVTAGAVVVLQRDNLVMVATSSSNLYQNTYKDGKISQNVLGKLAGLGSHFPGRSKSGETRTFVTGEKMWVTNIDVKDNAVVFDLFTDAFGDTRYKAALTIPLPKGPPPTAGQAAELVGEVLKVQPSDDGPSNAQQTPAATARSAQRAEAPPPPIAPPPPPPDAPPPAPKTVSLKEAKDQVVADFGQPDKVAKLGTKEIYYYKDFKVTFVGGKVTDVQ